MKMTNITLIAILSLSVVACSSNSEMKTSQLGRNSKDVALNKSDFNDGNFVVAKIVGDKDWTKNYVLTDIAKLPADTESEINYYAQNSTAIVLKGNSYLVNAMISHLVNDLFVSKGNINADIINSDFLVVKFFGSQKNINDARPRINDFRDPSNIRY